MERFLKAQESDYQTALQELQEGEKRSHWIWYIFPQMRGLGRSYYSDYYGIASLDEAKTYLENPVLSSRLRECVLAVTAHAGSLTADEIFGGLDAKKFMSSMTLFDAASPGDIYGEALVCFFGGERCKRTLELIARY